MEEPQKKKRNIAAPLLLLVAALNVLALLQVTGLPIPKLVTIITLTLDSIGLIIMTAQAKGLIKPRQKKTFRESMVSVG